MTNYSNYEIRRAEYDDPEEILNLQKECYLEEVEIYQDFKIPPLTQTIESNNADFKNHIMLKYEISNEIVGSVRAQITDKCCKIGR